MAVDTLTLLEALNSVTAIPVIPYDGDKINFSGHRKNINYLMSNNYLDGGRPRVVAIAGTSLIHHISPDDQTKLIDEAGREMGADGILMSGIMPNPLSTAGKLIEDQAKLQRPPDVYLLMPVSGVHNPDGLYDEYMRFGEKYGQQHGARFVHYFRQKRDRDILVKLVNESPHFVGIKVGTDESDVQPLIDGVGDNGLIIWGIGDRSTEPAKLGAKGHTSGIAVVCARASDELNNAQRKGDYATSQKIEDKIVALEDIRFRNGRVYNYSAVVEAMILSAFKDIEGGSGGPFNPRVPADVASEVQAAIKPLLEYH